MEENKEMLELLKQINEGNKKQAKYLKIQCILTLVAAVCFAGTFLLVYDFLPQIGTVVTQLRDVAAQLPGVVSQMEVVLGNLEQVTTDLAAVDFNGMIDGVNTLVQTGQTSLVDTVEKLNTIDFDALNKAIASLSDVVEPLAKFMKAFG